MSNRYGAVAIRTSRDVDPQTLLREVAGVPPRAELVPSAVQPFTRKGEEGTLSVLTLSDGWRVVWGGFLLEWRDDEPLAAALERASAGGEAVFWFVEGTSGSFGFMVFEDGRRVRAWWETEGRVVEDAGDPLPGEPEGLLDDEPNGERDEWAVVERIVAPRVGTWEEITGAPCVTFDVRHPRQRGPIPDSPQGGLLDSLRRWIFG